MSKASSDNWNGSKVNQRRPFPGGGFVSQPRLDHHRTDVSRMSPPMTAMGDHTDATLLIGLKASDKEAFELIYRTFASGLYNYARRNIPGKEDCEEIVQDIFESLWARRGSLEVKSTLEGYLIGMARHKIIHYFRKSALKRKYRDHFLLFEAMYEQAENPAEADPSAMQAALDKLIGELPDRCREALRLRLSENLSNGDIARRMRINTRTVESYMFKAFNHIRASYRKYTGNSG
jgi:RNA polymerase sigma-70 factor (ECF subfamily)